MDMQIDIYQCGSKHIHVILRGMAEGAVAFFDFNTFSKFVDQCHLFVQQHANNKDVTGIPKEEKADSIYAVPDVFLSAFDPDDKRNP